jgi:hypothetical protein
MCGSHVCVLMCVYVCGPHVNVCACAWVSRVYVYACVWVSRVCVCVCVGLMCVRVCVCVGLMCMCMRVCGSHVCMCVRVCGSHVCACAWVSRVCLPGGVHGPHREAAPVVQVSHQGREDPGAQVSLTQKNLAHVCTTLCMVFCEPSCTRKALCYLLKKEESPNPQPPSLAAHCASKAR